MTMIEVEARRTVRGRREEVFAQYCDHESWTEWAGLGRVTLARRGSPERDGVGAIRVIENLGLGVREEVIAFEPPRRMRYRLLSPGVPIRDHEGEVELLERGEDTEIRWRCRFRPLVPGTGALMRAVVKRTFDRVLERLARRQSAQVRM